uniref:Uncharacterized protein n=1 Tax=Magallana gigas TaxID=29159 RepID=A0A8W8MEY9_MAGGI
MGTKTHVRRTAIHPGQTKGILTPDICHMQRHLKKESHIMFAVVMIQTEFFLGTELDSKSSFGKLFTNITTKSGEFFFRTTPVTNEAEKTINSRENIDCTIPTEPKIINLSQRDLNTGEIQLLEHGLKFTPTPKSDKVDVVTDTEEFCRKLRLKEFFQNENNSDISLVKNNKGFKPPLNRDKHLEDYISCLRNTANSNVTDKTVKSNISHKQYQAMQTLKNDPSIIIKNADKGGAIVIMDRDHYKEMSLSQLQDHQFYTKLEQNEDRRTMLKIEKLTRKYQDNLTDNEIEYLTKYEKTEEEGKFNGEVEALEVSDIQMSQDQEAFPQIQSVPQMKRLEHLLGRGEVVVGADELQFVVLGLLELEDREDAEDRDREFNQLT